MLFAVLLFGQVSAQKSVNADGTLKFRGNVAILVEGRSFTFQDGKFTKMIDDQTMSVLKTTLRMVAIEKFQNIAFGVVNRDDEANAQVRQLIEENKLEDYLSGYSVQAKNQGADYLYLVDITNYAENNSAFQVEIATRLIDIEKNFGYHKLYRSDAIKLGDDESLRAAAKKIVHEVTSSLEEQLNELFPEQWYVAKADGKKWYCGAYQPNGRILPSDKFYAFTLSKDAIQIGQARQEIQCLDKVAIATDPTVDNGYLKVKSNKNISDLSNVILVRNLPELLFYGTNQIPITFFGLSYDLTSYEGLIKSRVNNAVYDAITRHPGLQLIEHDHLEDIRKERELQKSEDFLDGHVVQQMKAIGAKNLIKLDGMSMNGAQVSFKLSLISVEKNQIIRTVDVTSSIDNLENEMYKQICERFAFPCNVKVIDGKTVEIISALSLRDGDDCILEFMQENKNPMTNESSYTKVDVCKLKFEEYHGFKSIMKIDKMLSEQDIKKVAESSFGNISVTYRLDGENIRSNVKTESEVQKKSERTTKKKGSSFLKKVGSGLKGMGKDLLNNAKVTVQ